MAEFTDVDREEVHYFIDKLLRQAAYRRQDKATALLDAQAEVARLRSKLKALSSALKGVADV